MLQNGRELASMERHHSSNCGLLVLAENASHRPLLLRTGWAVENVIMELFVLASECSPMFEARAWDPPVSGVVVFFFEGKVLGCSGTGKDLP